VCVCKTFETLFRSLSFPRLRKKLETKSQLYKTTALIVVKGYILAALISLLDMVLWQLRVAST
jgi:hypothetical protein